MAITLADFTKIWASTSPLTPYSFSESNYKEGWNFIGSTPPSRQMWDSIQKQNDEKLKYIVDNFLPLDGGTMTGAIVLADGGNPLSTAGGTMTGAVGFDSTGQVGFRGETHSTPPDVCKQLIMSSTDIDHWTDEGGAKISLHTYDTTQTNTQEDGSFNILATDGTNSSTLQGKPNGDLKWNGNNVLTDGFVGNIVSDSTGDKSVTASTSVTVTTISLSKGVWVVTGHVMFDGTSGYNYGAQVVDTQYFTYAQDGAVSVAPGSNQSIALQPTRIFNLQSTTTIYLNVYTVGGTATAKGNILTAVRIA